MCMLCERAHLPRWAFGTVGSAHASHYDCMRSWVRLPQSPFFRGGPPAPLSSFLLVSPMQRRSGLNKGLARISPPSQHRLSGMGAVDPSRSRWLQRSFGVPNRIWALLLLVVSIVSLTRILPVSQTHTQVTTIGLTPKNYFRESSSVPAPNASESDAFTLANHPFDFCPVFGPNDDLAERYGALALAQSRIHLGSGGRVHRMLHKALLGQPVTISVLGGSGACHLLGNTIVSFSVALSVHLDPPMLTASCV